MEVGVKRFDLTKAFDAIQLAGILIKLKSREKELLKLLRESHSVETLREGLEQAARQWTIERLVGHKKGQTTAT